MKRSHAVPALLALAAHAGSALAQTQVPTSWELSGEFNTSNNSTTNPNVPGQVWTYGRQMSPSPTNAVAIYNMLSPGNFYLPGSLIGWKSGSNWAPAVYQNVSAAVSSYGLARVPIRGVFMLPGFSCERAAVRFTPPSKGTYRMSGQFWGSSYVTTPVDATVYIRKVSGNVPSTVFNGVIDSNGQMQRSFTSKTVGLLAGDTLDFEVGCGPSGGFPFGLFTGIHAVVERTGDYCPAAGGCPPPQ